VELSVIAVASHMWSESVDHWNTDNKYRVMSIFERHFQLEYYIIIEHLSCPDVEGCSRSWDRN